MSGAPTLRRLLVALVLLPGLKALAEDNVTLHASHDLLVGTAVTSSVGHIGLDKRGWSLHPVWAFQVGRFRLASGPAASLLSVGREPVEAGLSTVLTTAGDWRLSTALRIREGRDADDGDPLLSGLPGTRATLLGRLSASRAIAHRWTGSVSATQDLLGNGAGFSLGLGLGYRYPISQHTYWDASAALGWSNATARQTHFGISPPAAAAAGRAPYAIGAGWDSATLAWNLTSALSEHWVVWGGLNVSQLQGAAARSPLVGQRTVVSASIGLAYRDRH